MRIRHILAVSFLLCVACSNQPNMKVLPIGQDTYLLSQEAKVMGWGNLARMKAGVYREAMAFAERKGKVAITVSTNEAPVAYGKYAYFELKFRLVDKNDPAAQAANSAVATRDSASQQKGTDLYTELTKLDELHKKGLLTDAEFEAEKKKLLARHE